MSQTKDQDQSMEEILQSIKRIIAEEGSPANATGSDVLELTDMLGDDSAVAVPPGMEPPAAAMPTMSIEEIMAAPLSSGPQAPAATPEPAPVPEPEPAPAPVAAAPQPAPTPAAAVAAVPMEALYPTEKDEPLASPSTISSATAALNALKNIPETPLPPLTLSGVGFRSGTTIEDLVLEALKPLLKDWLDSNLTAMVERLVEKEVRKLSQR